MKKLISILCMLCCIFSLVACGNNSGESTSPTNEPVETASATDDTTKTDDGTGITETETLKVGKAEYAAHGTKGFCIAFAVMQGDTIVAAYVDDYQVMAKDDATVVPNSDSDFGKYFADTKSSLASKRVNSDYYSKLMKDNAGATISISENFDAIGNYAVGKTIKELEDELSLKDEEKMVDAVSGSTLADTRGYLLAILDAAKNAQAVDNAVNNEDVNDQTGNGNPSGVSDNNSDLSENGTTATGDANVTATGDANATTTDNANAATTDNANVASPKAKSGGATTGDTTTNTADPELAASPSGVPSDNNSR